MVNKDGNNRYEKASLARLIVISNKGDKLLPVVRKSKITWDGRSDGQIKSILEIRSCI